MISRTAEPLQGRKWDPETQNPELVGLGLGVQDLGLWTVGF